jgi:hypothetical protein
MQLVENQIYKKAHERNIFKVGMMQTLLLIICGILYPWFSVVQRLVLSIGNLNGQSALQKWVEASVR